MLRAQGRAQTSYRASFVIEFIGSTFATSLDLLTVIVLFRVTKTLGGFDFASAFLMSTIAAVGFSIADMIVGNIDQLNRMVRLGQLDTMLVRPLGLLRQILATDFELRRFGRVIQGIVALVIAAGLAHPRWSVGGAVLLVVAPTAGAVFFGSIFVIGGSVAFWWIDSSEFSNGFTYGGRDFTSYPITVYGSIFRRLFAFGLGFAFVSYYPTLAILGRPDPLGLPRWTAWTSPLVAALMFTVAAVVWRVGVRHYRSTGS